VLTFAGFVAGFERELVVAEEAARKAGDVLLRRYRDPAGPSFETKPDGSPVSQADLEANAVIEATLRQAFPGDAWLSEESADDLARLGASRVWIVDPLDGTRGFLGRTDDFGVHVALAVEGAPTVGVVFHPVQAALYRAVAGQGAFRVGGDGVTRIRTSSSARLADFRIGISRTNAPPALLQWLEREGLAARAVRWGASGKYTSLAQGDLEAVVTVTFGEKEWDSCAPELIVREAGGEVTDGQGGRLTYNQRQVDRPRGVVSSNGACHPELLARLAGLYP
jgi:3'-phosphoadenosine 5'-phosphosulfate (PAPS) 3'-phosphatase